MDAVEPVGAPTIRGGDRHSRGFIVRPGGGADEPGWASGMFRVSAYRRMDSIRRGL